jgi:hypothetical protein
MSHCPEFLTALVLVAPGVSLSPDNRIRKLPPTRKNHKREREKSKLQMSRAQILARPKKMMTMRKSREILHFIVQVYFGIRLVTPFGWRQGIVGGRG